MASTLVGVAKWVSLKNFTLLNYLLKMVSPQSFDTRDGGISENYCVVLYLNCIFPSSDATVNKGSRIKVLQLHRKLQ